MRRTGAAERYFFGAAYFDRLLESDRSWLALATRPERRGRRRLADGAQRRLPPLLPERQRRRAPARLADEERRSRRWSSSPPSWACRSTSAAASPRGDRLEEFKRGFANREQPWHTSEIVCDRAAYDRLSAGRDTSGFFPPIDPACLTKQFKARLSGALRVLRASGP